MAFKYRPPGAVTSPPTSCSKVSYDTKKDAVADAQYMRNNSRTRFDHLTGQKLRPYECEICGNWHLTSSSRSRNHKLRQRDKTIARNKKPRSRMKGKR